MNLEPTHLQQSFIASAVKETLYGGARGGGKTFAVILDWVVHSEAFGRFAKGIVFRRSLVELDDFIEKSKDILIAAGHSWMEGKKQFVSPKGAILRCRYLDNDDDAALYQGHEYTRVYIEEIGNFPNESPVRKLLSTLRSGHGVPCRLKATANPGGAGHTWVKGRYIDPAAAMTPFSTDNGKSFRVYIPAKLTDNPHLMRDPEYEAMIRQAGSVELVKAWLDGDWDVVVGQYFKEFRRADHVIPTVKLPDSFSVRYRSHDWGSARPFANYWQAVATGDPIPGVERHIPRGALIFYRELYGWNGTANQGCRWTAKQVGRAIRQAESEGVNEDHRIIDANNGLHKIDPSTFATNGGPPIAEEMARVGVWFTRADNRRVAKVGAIGGWDQVRSRLIGEEVQTDIFVPMIYFMDCCTHLLRTLPTLPSDPTMPDDIDTKAEDHAADAVRYGCMARPYDPPDKFIKKSNVRTLGDLTMEEAWKCQYTNNSRIIMRN